MKLSVIIPVYNNAQYLPRCLKSLEGRGEIEIVVVDDGSDEPVRLEESEGIRLVREENRGVFLARRRGVEEAKGEYVWFVDADDEAIEVPAELEGDLVRFRQDNGWMCIGDKIYSRELALKAFDELGDLGLKHCEDGLFYLAAKKHAKRIVDADRSIYRYVDTPGSATHRFNPDAVEERERFVDEYVRLAPEADRAKLSKESAVFIACALCRWKAQWREIRRVARRLAESRLVKDGAEEIAKDAYARKMMFAVRHPWMIIAYRIFR